MTKNKKDTSDIFVRCSPSFRLSINEFLKEVNGEEDRPQVMTLTDLVLTATSIHMMQYRMDRLKRLEAKKKQGRPHERTAR